MIFKTFDSDKDTFSSKFGILGKSFEDIGNRFKKVSDELIATNDYTISNIANAWKNSSVKKDLSDKFIITKSDIQDKLKDLSVYEKNPQGILDNLLEQKELVDSNQSSWQKYFEGLAEGEKWQVKFVQENDLTKVSLDDVKNAQNAAKQSAIAYNNGLEQMTIGTKAANIALEGLKMAANMIAGMLIAEGIQLVVTAIDNYIHRVEKANDAMDEAVSEYDSAKTALKDTTSQLEEQNKRIDELNKKDKLTYVEQEELDKLKEATRQLELQKNIEEKEKANSAREAADKTVTAFNKQYGKGDIDKNAVDTQLAQSKATGVFQEARNSDDIVGNLASFEYYTEQMEKTQKRYNKALKSGSKDDIKYYEENLQDCIDTVDEYTTSLNNNIEDLTKKKNNLQDAYDNAVKKKSSGESLSSDEKDTISKYQEIADIIKLIYSYTDKAGWNNSQISEIFNTNGIEKSKEDLQQLAQEGKLTEEELQKYPNLMNAINNAEFLGEKNSNLKVFCDDLNAGVDAITNTANAADSATPSLTSFDEAWINLKNTDDSDLKGAVDDLLDLANAGQLTGNALESLAGGQKLMSETGLSADELAQKINGLVNASTQLSSMSAQISKMSDMLADKKNGTVASASDLAGFDVSVRGLESWDKFEEVMGSSESSMEQCQKAANDLATEWVNDGNFLSNLTDENKQYYITQLDQMGVENASTVVEEALANKRAEEAAQTEYNTTATEYNTKAKAENEKVTTDLTDATPKEVAEILAEASASKAAKKSIAELYLSKLDINNTKINTKDDVNNIVAIAKAAGVSKQYISQLQSALDKLVNGNTYSNGTKFSDLQFGMTSGKIDYSSGLPTIDELKKKGTQQQAKKSAEDIVKQINDSFTEIKMPDIKIKPTGSSSYKSPSSKKSKSKTKSDAAEVFDFIEIKLNNLTDKASNAKDKIDDLLTFGQKKNQTKKAIEATTKAITAQEKAYKKYMAYANKAAKTQNSKKTTSSSSSTGGNAVYDTATDYLGLKYVWGGASLTKGADCSGFTQQIYKKFGVSLPHHAADQAKMGTKITSKKNLQAGDLVFFGSKNNITHVGIYGGDGKFIESPHTGASVRVSKLSSRKDFVSGSRFSKINDAIVTTTTSGKNVKKVKGVSSKTLEHYKKLIREGTLDGTGIASIKNENLKNALKDYQTYYEKAKACKEQVASLTDQLKDLYETLANNPIDNASDKIEKLGTKMDILNAKVGNLTFNPTKKIGTSDIDSLYKQIIKNYDSQLSASKTAYTGATKSYNSNKSSLTKSLKKTKAKNIGLTQKEFNSIKSNLKSNKSISYNLINKIGNDSLREKCIAHNEYLLAKNTATDNYNQAKEDHTSNVRQARKDRFDKVQARYDNKAGLIEQRKNAVSNSLSIAEAKGQLIGDAYYTRQADAVKSDMQLKQEEAEKLAKKLSKIKFGSDEWYEAQDALNGVYEAIQQDEQELAEFQKSINQLKFDRFDELLNKLGDITDETDFLIDMLDSDNLFDSDTGMITQDGITAMGLTAQNYDTYLAEAEQYKKQIADLNKMYNEGKIGLTDYNSQLRTYQQGQRDSIKSANEAKKSLVAYVKQGLDAQNEALEEAISKKKELLETEKDLKEFQDKIADQNKNIAKLQKQIAALEGDDSEENRKKLQQLKSDLKDAEKEQSDTLYDRSVSDQEKALDDMLTKSKESAEDYLKDTNKVFSDALTYVNANSSQVASNIEKIAKDTGYDVSTYIVNAWKDGGDAVGDYASTLSSNIPNITAQLGLIASSWQSICKAADEAAEASAKYAETKVTDTQGIGSSNDSGTSSGNGSVSSGSNDDDKQQELNKLRKKASDITEWISKHSVSATHKKSYYGSLNQYLYDKQHGQVLSKANEVALAKKLGVSVKSDLSGKNDREKITSALKKLIKDASFSTGGVATNLVKISGEDGISFIQRGEAVFSKEDTQALLSFKPVIPQINSIVDNLKNIPEKVSSQSPTYQIDNRTIVEGVATDQIVKQMEGVAQKQAENVVRKINQATYAKGVRK